MTSTQQAHAPAWADDKDAWLNRVHDAVLTSGIRVTYRDLSLGEFAELDALPEELLELAVREWAEPGSLSDYAVEPQRQLPAKPTKKQRAAANEETRKRFDQIKTLNRQVIMAALVAPKLTTEELEQVPMPDLEMLSGLINRTIAQDAAGRTVGVVLVDRFRAILAAHGIERCAPDCASCEEARRQMATSR